jgi:hypothetical protein
MKKFLFLILFLPAKLFAQADTAAVIVDKDPRIDLLVKKQIQINEETTRDSRRNVPGYRMVINSSD